jgi:voltage-gated potassium channel
MSRTHKQRAYPAFLIVMVILIDTVGYEVLEGWGWFDSRYMTVITITTIGFKEVKVMSDAGRGFTVFLIFFSAGAMSHG